MRHGLEAMKPPEPQLYHGRDRKPRFVEYIHESSQLSSTLQVEGGWLESGEGKSDRHVYGAEQDPYVDSHGYEDIV